ncbi:hypothetical protein AB0J81_07750 [Streptomyces bobili]|uniref:hypothetical protein n=1 Tax=Streptomyces bobili TaxID=67280 RepID=UPI003429C72B
MPATVVDDPLAVRFVLRDGSELVIPLHELANPVLAHDLALGMAANAHPHGGINAKGSAYIYAGAVRQMVAELVAQGFTGSAAELTRPLLVRYWLGGSSRRETYTRNVLKGFDRLTSRLRPEVRAYLGGQKIQAPSQSQPSEAYTDAEWDRLETACRTVVDDACARHRRALALARSGGDPRLTGRGGEEDIAALMLRDGPMTFPYYVDYIRGYVRGSWNKDRERPAVLVRRVREALFPTRQVEVAFRLLFGVYSGLVPDGIHDLELGGIEWAGNATVLLTYLKGRTSRESVNLPKRAVRLLERWLELSAPLREFGTDANRHLLWIAHSQATGEAVNLAEASSPPQRAFAKALDLRSDHGATLEIDRRRIRATYHERLARRGWSGAVTIDPNHTPGTEGDHYVTPTSTERIAAVESIIEDGMSQVLGKALPPVVLSTDQAAELARDFPAEVHRLGLDATAVAELVGGERDVFTAACADQLAGVHGPAGRPCPARPWVCLLCPLAVFLPRHAANLLRLEAFFARQFRQMPTDHFLRVFGPYADRLSREILPRLHADVQAKARLDVADDDSELPLRPEERTQ